MSSNTEGFYNPQNTFDDFSSQRRKGNSLTDTGVGLSIGCTGVGLVYIGIPFALTLAVLFVIGLVTNNVRLLILVPLAAICYAAGVILFQILIRLFFTQED